jgi:hypothetical protein
MRSLLEDGSVQKDGKRFRVDKPAEEVRAAGGDGRAIEDFEAGREPPLIGSRAGRRAGASSSASCTASPRATASWTR